MSTALSLLKVGRIKLSSLSSERAWEFFRFLIGGALNTIVGYGGYLLLLRWLQYAIAYTLAYIISVAISYLFSALVVFRRPLKLRAALRYPLVYFVQFLIGFCLLKIMIELLHVSTWFAPLLVSLLTIPVTFYLSRIIVRAG